MTLLRLLFFLVLSPLAYGDAMYKCKVSSGRILYTNSPCPEGSKTVRMIPTDTIGIIPANEPLDPNPMPMIEPFVLPPSGVSRITVSPAIVVEPTGSYDGWGFSYPRGRYR